MGMKRPNFTKIYECRPQPPISVIFPRDYDQTLPQALPTIFITHGGGFCMGSPGDDDVWSERFATMHNALVVELNYRKAPAHPFQQRSTTSRPSFELGLVVYASYDRSMAKSGRLLLVVIYPLVDQTFYTREKLKMRYCKPDLRRSTRGRLSDLLAASQAVPAFTEMIIDHFSTSFYSSKEPARAAHLKTVAYQE
ncbi:hypothetical protein F4782DRAFT_541433 [Xylaria castorea]|nr:hypothetical protein F4782DRAFT_541433 [Xylaria castorea]